MGTFNVVLPWDHSKSDVTFQTEDNLLEEPKASLNFFCWELFDYGLDMKMKLSTYIKEIRLRQASIRKIKRLNTHMSFMLGSQFSCLTNLETRFQIVVDKLVLYKKIKCYNAKEILIEDEEDVDYIHFVKARPGRLFKHELEALKHKFELPSLDGYAIKKFYGLQACSSRLEPKEKPPIDAYHHEVECFYQTLNHFFFTQETPFNMIYTSIVILFISNKLPLLEG